MISSLWTRPQGCQKTQTWINFEKLSQKQSFLIDFLDSIRFVEFGLNISAKTHQNIDSCALPVLLTPWGCVYIDLHKNSVRSGCVVCGHSHSKERVMG